MELRIDLPMDAGERLEAYAALVRRWGTRLDLVSPTDLDRFEERHIADALRALPLLDSLPPGPCIDVGSGAGVPGVPLAIARPERLWRLLEPRARRAGFLEEVVRSLDLNCEVVTATAESAVGEPRLAAAHVLATARALAAPAPAAALVSPLVAPTGVGLLWLGEKAELPPALEEWAEGLALVRAPGRVPNVQPRARKVRQ
ncbi:MAG TPA: RsmG family class I SAM-dependent methyltransferase [Actinomycetota bacterium]|nr:RsmG family class I SAM-dependent methyltransferase [Actinomycetota bacterium]